MKKALLMLAAIVTFTQNVSAEPVGGSQYGCHLIDDHETQEFTVRCYGCRPVTVALAGMETSDVDVFVYNQFGRLVGEDTGHTDVCLVQFTPHRTEWFTIRVVNRDCNVNRYAILVK